LIHYPDRDPLEVACYPEANHADILERHPDAVAAEPFSPTIRQPTTPLTAEEETAIRAWLVLIEETDPATIAEVIGQCQRDADARDYFTGRAAAEIAQECPPRVLTKLTKPPFGSFGSEQDEPFSKNLPAIRLIRTHMLEVSDRLGIDPVIVHRIPDDEVELWAALEGKALEAGLLMLDDDAARHAGKVPLDDTAAVCCARCGPVWLSHDIARVLPVVAGWPHALGCPWCHVRKAGGYVPRPPVACAGCTHFRPDHVNPVEGMGACAAGHARRYPMQPHPCDSFNPRR
jgi:hypothetical protein